MGTRDATFAQFMSDFRAVCDPRSRPVGGHRQYDDRVMFCREIVALDRHDEKVASIPAAGLVAGGERDLTGQHVQCRLARAGMFG